MREIKFKFLMENGEITRPYYLKELIDSDSYINIECEYSSRIKQELQYTGLKDKINRNEIYEHDIINHLQYGFLKVEWDYENTGWCCLSKTYKKFRLIEILQLGGIKVGNIYENKELLKEDNVEV